MPLLVFSDLDGTLLDHRDYSFAAAAPALAALAARGAGVVLASSKTAAEIAPLRAEMGLADWPAIVENGAGVLAPGTGAGAGDDDYPRLRAALDRVPPALRRTFRGFGDMDTAEVAAATGLAPEAAARARDRRFSEPGTWTGSDADRAAFVAALAREGVAARDGGRFLTLSFGATKADRMTEIAGRLAPALTVALGDAPNDAEMLMAADRAFIVANPDGPGLPPLEGEAEGRIRRTERAGPSGWNEAILGLLAEIAPEPGRAGH